MRETGVPPPLSPNRLLGWALYAWVALSNPDSDLFSCSHSHLQYNILLLLIIILFILLYFILLYSQRDRRTSLPRLVDVEV